MTDENQDVDEITIKISESDVYYESDLSFTEVIFWLEMLKTMMLNNILDQ